MATPMIGVRIVCRSVFCNVFNKGQWRLQYRSYHVATTVSCVRLQATLPLLNSVRHGTFFRQITANELWKGVVGVSSAGKMRGRGKRVGRKKVMDLNKGQILGSGKANIMWPGLNAPVVKGREVVERKKLPADPERQQELVKLRDQMSRIRYYSLPPLKRGWSGGRLPGQSMGPPDDIADYTFENFDARVLQFRLVTNMTGTLGRKQRFSVFVVAGNANGLAGYGLGKAQLGRAAIRVAKNRAAQQLMYIPRFDDHTVYHNMFSQYHKTKVFIHKREKGYGLKCHRAIKTICQLMGIKDLHAKVEGNTKNVQAVTKAFFNALVNQETHQELADRTRLHVVEFRQEREQCPVVVASPSEGFVRSKPLKDDEEDIDMSYERLYYGGKVEYAPAEDPRFYHKLRSWRYKRAKVHMDRNQREADTIRRAGLW